MSSPENEIVKGLLHLAMGEVREKKQPTTTAEMSNDANDLKNLPAELRLKIWDAMAHSRIVEVAWSSRNLPILGLQCNPRILAGVPKLLAEPTQVLQLCQEARWEQLKPGGYSMVCLYLFRMVEGDC
jgi:hypothetical protein